MQAALDLHNQFRALHQKTGPLVLDADVSRMAQEIADRKVWGHSQPDERNGYGENLALNTESSMLDAVTLGITQWYEEIDHYNYNSPAYKDSNGEMLGHFTQVRRKIKS